jgi:exonuclease III
MDLVEEEQDLSGLDGFANLSIVEQHELSEEVRHGSIAVNQQLSGVLLSVCSWNPNPDSKLGTAFQKKKCIYGTLGALAPDVVCLQETIWAYQKFCGQLKNGKSWKKKFIFAEKWKSWGKRGSKEAAILYNPDKFEVDVRVAAEARDAWRHHAQELGYGLRERTLILQGKIQPTGPDVIFMSTHMFAGRSSCSTDKRLEMTESIISQAQQFANDRKVTVILCGDWNCPVNYINLPDGACLPIPMSARGDTDLDSSFEEGGIDGMILLNPITNHGNMKLTDVQFFRWTGNVTADEMNGLDPAFIDSIYCKGGKHRPIVANIKAD